MPKSSVLDYIKNRVESNTHEKSGPVVTVSREYGCPGLVVGPKIAERLSNHYLPDGGNTGDWRFLDKELIREVAEQVKLPSSLVEKIASSAPRGIMAEFFDSFTSSYLPSDIEIKKSLARLIRGIAHQGSVVLLGRATAVLCSDMERALHIRLFAPLEWRIQTVAARDDLTESAARQAIETIDRERIYLQNFYAGEQVDSSLFHVTFNCAKLSPDDIADAVEQLMVSRNLVKR